MSATETGRTLAPEDRATLLAVARAAIRHAIERGGELPVDPEEFAPALREPRATFVTLELGGELAGCIGTLVARESLVESVAHNARAAAFDDPRFDGVRLEDLDALDVHVSVLSPPEPMAFASEEDLLAQIRPGVDGLLLEDGFRRGTFLPSVWETLPDARNFLSHLKRKAGLPVDYWSPNLRVSRYTSESFGP